jgi:hypothetical protein
MLACLARVVELDCLGVPALGAVRADLVGEDATARRHTAALECL